jgi:hypothetical protein
MSREGSGNNNRSNTLAIIADLEQRRNALLLQHREVSQLMQQYSNQSFELTTRIDEISATIRRLTEELHQLDEEEAAMRRRHREQMLAKRREVEEGRAKARQWFEERERRRKGG